MDDLSESLVKCHPRVSELKKGLTPEELQKAYDYYWRGEHVVVRPLIDEGLTDLHTLKNVQLEWLFTLDLELLCQHEERKDNSNLPRRWAPQLTDLEYTYVERIRVHMYEEGTNFERIRRLEESLSSERNGLAFAGMMFGNTGNKPISPTWVALNSGNVRPNGRAAGAGWPSHRTLDLPDALDLSAIGGPNVYQRHDSTPEGMTMPNNNIYFGTRQDRHFEMVRIGGDIISMDLDNNAARAAIIEHWGRSEWRIAIADVSTGIRRYIHAPTDLTGHETIQLSSAADWILISSYKEPLAHKSQRRRHRAAAA